MTAPSTRRPSVRRLLAFAALWLSISGAAIFAPGCYGRNCEGGSEVFGAEAGQGRMLDENTWESSPQSGAWLWYPRQTYYSFTIPALGGRTPEVVIPYLSASLEPSKNGGNFTIGSGNIAEFFAASPNRIDLKNDTCSDYYLRLYIKVPPLPPAQADGAAPATDAGVDDAATGDAEAGP